MLSLMLLFATWESSLRSLQMGRSRVVTLILTNWMLCPAVGLLGASTRWNARLPVFFLRRRLSLAVASYLGKEVHGLSPCSVQEHPTMRMYDDDTIHLLRSIGYAPFTSSYCTLLRVSRPRRLGTSTSCQCPYLSEASQNKNPSACNWLDWRYVPNKYLAGVSCLLWSQGSNRQVGRGGFPNT